MANNESKTVEDVEEKKVDPVAPSEDDEYLPVAPAPGGMDNPPDNSVVEPTPGEQPAAPTEPATPAEPVTPAAGEPPAAAPAAQPAAVVPDEEDVTLLAQSLKNLSTDHKKLPNETPVEYARRLEIIRLRRKGQTEKATELLGEKPAPVVPAPTEEQQLDPDEIADFAAKAKAAGFVPKAEADAAAYNQSLQTAFDSWIANSPEFNEVNDPEGLLWGQLKEQFQSGLYNTRPKNPQDIVKILDNIKHDMLGIQPTSALKKVTAQQEKIKVASHTGATPGGGAPPADNPAAKAKAALLSKGLRGFTEEEIAELAKDE